MLAAPSDSAGEWTRDDAAHLLRRAGFGGTPQQIDRLHALGRNGAVEYLLGGGLPAGKEPVFEAAALEDFKPAPPPELDPQLVAKAREGLMARRLGKAPAAEGKPAEELDPKMQEAREAAQKLRQTVQRAGQQDLQRMRGWWVDRMVRTDRPLEEKMTQFWHGLFTSGVREVKNPSFMVQQNALFHREALGNYKKLTHEIVHDPAMLVYLNNNQNVKGKPNENLARELMELFTMGEGKGYTENDIKEVARALTGLTVGPGLGGPLGIPGLAGPPPGGPFGRGPGRGPLNPLGGRKNGEGESVLRPRLHDDGPKTIFGKTGDYGPDDVVELIFERPEPARHLARKLWEFYAYPNPSDGDLEPVVRALKQNKYDLKPALRALFTSPAFYGERAKFALIKSPAELAVETMRTLGGPCDERVGLTLVQRMGQMDQQLLQPPNVRGWVGGDNWITASTLYARYNTASAIVNGTLNMGPRMPLRGKPGAGANKGEKGEERMNLQAAREATIADEGGGRGAISVAKLFPSVGAEPTSEQVVDAAIARFLQRPLHPEKRAALVDALGDAALKLGEPATDARVRQMLCLLLSTPEYQVH